jgi:hypothetical protein
VTHEVNATPKLRPRSFTFFATAVTSSSVPPASAFAPAIFSRSTVTPTPRRPAVQVLSSTATSSFVTTDVTLMPSSSASSAAILKFITSPV